MKAGELAWRRRVVTTTLGITQTLAWGSTYYLPAVFADPVCEALGLSRALFFGIFSGALLLSGLVGPTAGRLMDTYGGRDVLAASNLVFAAGLALLSFASGPITLALAWAVIGVGMGFGLYEAAFATVTGLYGREARNAITGITLFAGFASTVDGTDGTVLGEELVRIGYAGPHEPGFLRPHAYLELHIEQRPVLEREGVPIGAVEKLQGISWQRVTIEGEANHAGTAPMAMRRDAGQAAARAVIFLRDRLSRGNSPTVATVGCMTFQPNAINVIPFRAAFTVDLRDPDEERLWAEKEALARYLDELAEAEEITITVERLARFEPVTFDPAVVEAIEATAVAHGLRSRRMTSGAGHNAQMMARICLAAMIFVPSIGGISHNPLEHTPTANLEAGANVLLDVVRALVAPR